MDWIDKLANQKVEGTPLKSIFSYGGMSFWWRLKNLILEKRVKTLDSLKLTYYTAVDYRAKQLKDLVYGKFSGGKFEQKDLLIFSLDILRSRYFTEIEAELQNRKIPYNFVGYSSTIPNLKSKNSLHFESFVDYSILKEEEEVRSLFQKKFQLLYSVLEPYFESKKQAELVSHIFLSNEIPEMLRRVRMAEKMIQELKPKLILLTQETGKHSYPVVVAALNKGITTVSFQHGIHDVPLDYPDSSVVSRGNPFDYFLPDVMLTYGQVNREKLIKNGIYAEDKIFAVGQPRYDTLFKKCRELNVKELRKKYGLDPEKKILLWATQSHAWFNDPKVNEENAAIVFDGLPSDWQLGIKLHQGEDQSAPVYSKFNSFGKARIFTKSSDTFELLILSDAVLITNSTVGNEAILADKPLLLIDSKKRDELYKIYVENGFDLVVEKGNLGELLKLVLTPSYRKKFKKLRDGFLENFCINFGNSAVKTVDLIRDQL